MDPTFLGSLEGSWALLGLCLGGCLGAAWVSTKWPQQTPPKHQWSSKVSHRRLWTGSGRRALAEGLSWTGFTHRLSLSRCNFSIKAANLLLGFASVASARYWMESYPTSVTMWILGHDVRTKTKKNSYAEETVFQKFQNILFTFNATFLPWIYFCGGGVALSALLTMGWGYVTINRNRIKNLWKFTEKH